MIKRSKLIAVLIAGVLCVTALTGCGSKKEKLTVWSHLTEAEIVEFQKIANEWGKENKMEVKIVEDKGKVQEMIQACNTSNGPDIILGMPHDNLGTFQKAGIVSEVPSGMLDSTKYTSKSIMDAVVVKGKQYGIPLAQETSTIFYNKDKVKEVPKTMEEIVTMGKDVGFEFDINNFYVDYSFISANGGYVYKEANGTIDPTDIGLKNEGALAGYEFIRSLVQDHKLMAGDITGDIAKADFSAGKTGFYISGPWDIDAFKKAGVNFGVTTMPTLNGKTMNSFLGVQVSIVNAKSKNTEKAWELNKYLADKSSEIVYNNGNRIPVLKDALNNEVIKNDEHAKAFIEQAKNSVPMPNIPEVQAMWTPAGDNIKLMNAGQLDVKTCGENIVNQIKEGISQLK
ncbi:sugar ABC transporter substrate-binding protein [Clostridium gasigenes]|uniref:sugar ABC transporter substrate-binding protein n=1 Tax=Clostridium gasigenes TaxID=94869 RepID=UPI001C0DE29F|nr:maltose ABC transporter substrate-binding protein [Clostridium gasigenes]MBU3108790.1 maltose ABC transporter substrate-binding protein [Clostridium gasigenes]